MAVSKQGWLWSTDAGGSTRQQVSGFQLDLVFNRADRVVTVCEVKYTDRPVTQSQARASVAAVDRLPLPTRSRLQRVLICTAGATIEVNSGLFFDRILTLYDLLGRP